MLSVKGYIDGNTVVTLDDGLRNFNGSEILIRLVKKPEAQPAVQRAIPAKTERRKALQAIQGVLKGCKPMTIAEIREERLAERYGL
ncbi:MAG: hypothetical protein IJP90_03375 [Treponema sp.]|nr:hypothetical protein [Treponema sp.]MBR0098738.1 hypothetical protein [Treponema sp.]